MRGGAWVRERSKWNPKRYATFQANQLGFWARKQMASKR